MKKFVQKTLGMLLVLSAVSVVSAGQRDFSLTSPAVKGKTETGYFTGLKSAGRLDAVYAAGEKGPFSIRSFPVSWKGLPKGTKALALIFDDPDAKPVMQANGMKGDSFLHWAAADIDPSLGGLADNASGSKHSFPQGLNAAGSVGYVGPCPPSDFPKGFKKPLIHIYRLTVFALSTPTGLKDGFSPDALQSAMKGKVIGKAELCMSYNN